MGQVVSLILSSKTFMTSEQLIEGRPVGTPCDLDGNPIDMGVKHPHQHPGLIEIYMGHNGVEYAKIAHSQMIQKRAAGEEGEVFQGIGEVAGWFVKAPDFTLIGRHGENAKKPAKSAGETQPAGRSEKNAAAKSKPGRKPAAKKAAKKTTVKGVTSIQ